MALHQIDQEKIDGEVIPNGLSLLSSVFSEEEQQEMINRVKGKGKPYHPAGLCIHSFADKKDTAPSASLAMPAWGRELCDRVHQLGILRQRPNYIYVLCYPPGTGVMPHIDEYTFGNEIAGISLGSPCVMQLRYATRKSIAMKMLLLPGDVYVLRDDARWDWEHSIDQTDADTFREKEYMRGTRYSLTLRTV